MNVAPPMKPNFLIQFLDEGVVFRHLAPDRSWIETGRLERQERWDTVKVDVIRRRAVRLGRGYSAAILLISKDFVNYTYVTLPEEGETGIESLIRRHIALTTGGNTDEFCFDYRESDGLVRIAYVDKSDLRKLRQFVAGFGFHPVAFACFHPDRHDFDGVSVMELTESARSRGISIADVQQDMALPGAGDPDSRPFDAHLEDGGADTIATTSGRSRNALAVALIAGAFGFATVFQMAGQAIAAGNSGAVEKTTPFQSAQHSAKPLLRTAQVVSSSPAPNFRSDDSPVFITSGWQSTIAMPRRRQTAATDAEDLADRGFDPGGLSYDLLALAVSTQPAEHDLFTRAPATVIVSTAEESAAADENISVAFADPGEQLSPFPAEISETEPQDQPADQQTDSETKPADINPAAPKTTQAADESAAEKPDPQDSWKPLKFERPTLRGGSRHQLKSLAFNRPSLRPGARDADAVQPGAEETGPAAIAAVVKAIEEDIDSQAFETAKEIPTTKPMRRPAIVAVVAVVSAVVEDRPAPVRTKPKRRPLQAAAGDPPPRITTVTADSQANTLPAAKTVAATTSALSSDLPTGGEGLNLQETNLIGVYGKPNFLRALVRLPSGKFVNLYAGGDFDGGQVVEITNRSVTYIKNGRKHELHMPN